MARHHDRGRQRAPGGQGTQHLEPSCAGHLMIHHEHIIGPRRMEGQPGITIARHLHGVPGALQRPLGQTRLPGIVVDHQDTYWCLCHGVTLPEGASCCCKASIWWYKAPAAMLAALLHFSKAVLDGQHRTVHGMQGQLLAYTGPRRARAGRGVRLHHWRPMLKVLCIIVLAFIVSLLAALFYGASRWNVGTQALRARLDAARVPLRPRAVDSRELEGLPANDGACDAPFSSPCEGFLQCLDATCIIGRA